MTSKRTLNNLGGDSNYKEEISPDLKDDIKIAFEIYQDDQSNLLGNF
jgi:hypothetical protein